MNPSEIKSGNQYILYDADQIGDIDAFSFDPQVWQGAGAITGKARGRGSAYFIRYQGREYVLRHYQRGGMISSLVEDSYLWTGLNRTRAWREWRLLARLYREGLPVPCPLAAAVIKSAWFYRADLVVQRIMGASALSARLSHGHIGHTMWRRIGACLRQFHLHGVCHADLNAHNILLNESGEVFVIDFDRGAIRPRGKWCQHNLARLLRSLNKLAGQSGQFSFSDEDWAALQAGYHGAD